MLASCSSIALITASLALTASAVPQPLSSWKRDSNSQSCSGDQTDGTYLPDQPDWAKGKIQGTLFCASKWDQAAFVTTISTYSKPVDGKCGDNPPLNRVDVTYSDGSSVTIGNADTKCRTGQLAISPDTSITKFSNSALGTVMYHGSDHSDINYGVPPKTAISQGPIWIETNKGGDVEKTILHNHDLRSEWRDGADNGAPDWPNGDWASIPTQDAQGGVITGVEANIQGDVITYLTFRFTKSPVYHARRKDFKFVSLDQSAIKTVDINNVTSHNPESSPVAFTYHDHRDVPFTFSNNLGSEVNLGVKLPVEQNLVFPTIDMKSTDDNVVYSWTDKLDDLHLEVGRGTGSVAWSKDVQQAPNSTTYCHVPSGQFNGDLHFTATLELDFKNGLYREFEQKGILSVKGLSSDQAPVLCKSSPLSQNSAKAYPQTGTSVLQDAVNAAASAVAAAPTASPSLASQRLSSS